MQASVQATVDNILQDKSKSANTFEHLVASLGSAQKRWAEIEKSIDNLARFEALSTSQFGDAQGAYGMAKELSQKKDTSPDERRAALGYLLKIIELGEEGRVDPNLLFNACSIASKMDFDHEALNLSTLCAHSLNGVGEEYVDGKSGVEGGEGVGVKSHVKAECGDGEADVGGDAFGFLQVI